MNTRETPDTIKEEVQKAVECGKVHMKPKWHFVLKTVAVLSAGLLAGLSLLYLVSFVFFVVAQNGAGDAPKFGLSGVLILLLSLPWVLVVASLLFILATLILAYKYSFAYGYPLVYSGLAILLLSVLGGAILYRTPIHARLWVKAYCKKLPVAGAIYRQMSNQVPKHITFGEITETTQEKIFIKLPNGEVVPANITKTRHVPVAGLSEGDRVMMFRASGSESELSPIGIHKIDAARPNIFSMQYFGNKPDCLASK